MLKLYFKNILLSVLFCASIHSCTNIASECLSSDTTCNPLLYIFTLHNLTPLIMLGDINGNVHFSRDGSSWKKVLVQSGFAITDIVHSQGRFWLTTANPSSSVFSSRDGESWDLYSNGLPTTLNSLSTILAGKERFVVAGAQDTTGVYSSVNGEQWTLLTSAGLSGTGFFENKNGAYLEGNYLGFNYFLGDGNVDLLMYSSDGVNWNQGYAGGSNLSHFVSIKEIFYFLSGTGTTKNVYSIDTVTTATAVYSPANLIAMSSGSQRIVATGMAGVIYSTNDGSTWTTDTSPISGENLSVVASYENLFITAGTLGSVAISLSNNKWTLLAPIPGSVSITAATIGVVTLGQL